MKRLDIIMVFIILFYFFTVGGRVDKNVFYPLC